MITAGVVPPLYMSAQLHANVQRKSYLHNESIFIEVRDIVVKNALISGK